MRAKVLSYECLPESQCNRNSNLLLIFQPISTQLCSLNCKALILLVDSWFSRRFSFYRTGFPADCHKKLRSCTKKINALSFYRSQNVLSWSKFFVPDQKFIYILRQSQTFCARQKEDLHSVKLVFRAGTKVFEEAVNAVNFLDRNL